MPARVRSSTVCPRPPLVTTIRAAGERAQGGVDGVGVIADRAGLDQLRSTGAAEARERPCVRIRYPAVEELVPDDQKGGVEREVSD